MNVPIPYTVYSVSLTPADPGDPEIWRAYAAPRDDRSRAVLLGPSDLPPDFPDSSPHALCSAIDAAYITVSPSRSNHTRLWRIADDGASSWELDLGEWGQPRGAYPLGPDDILVFCTWRWGRITNGVPGWSAPAPLYTTYGSFGGAAQKGASLHLLLYHRPGSWAVATMSKCVLDLGALPAVIPTPISIPCAIPGGSPAPIAMVADLVASPDVAIGVDHDSTSDGFGVYDRMAADALEVTGPLRRFYTRGVDPDTWNPAYIELYVGAEAGVVTSSGAIYTPYVPDGSGLPVDLPPGYTSWTPRFAGPSIIGWDAPQPVPPFWTDKVNTRETLG